MTKPKELGIQFTLEMHAAVREGRKTQTRRIIPKSFGAKDIYCGESDGLWVVQRFGDPDQSMVKSYRPGDHLYVRERVQFLECYDRLPPSRCKAPVRYLAEGREGDPWGRVRSAMFLPKWCARTWLEVTGVKAERVQDITEADAMAEGAMLIDEVTGHVSLDDRRGSYRLGFRLLWESIHGPGAWAKNAWVFAYTVRLIER